MHFNFVLEVYKVLPHMYQFIYWNVMSLLSIKKYLPSFCTDWGAWFHFFILVTLYIYYSVYFSGIYVVG